VVAMRISSFSLITVVLWAGAAWAESSLFRMGPLNPDFVAWRARQQAGAIHVLVPTNASSGLTPSPFDDSYLRRAELVVPLHIAAPSRYDLRTLGWVTLARNQGNCGSCFAFATYSSLESWLLKTAHETWDFSENHLKNYSGFDLTPCTGGDSLSSTAYLVRWAGPVAEVNDPFHDWDDRPSPGGRPCKYVTGTPHTRRPTSVFEMSPEFPLLLAPSASGKSKPSSRFPTPNSHDLRGDSLL